MEISRERRREIIAALRKGTVPQRGLDFLAVGLRPFESVIASELDDVKQGGAVFKAVRGDYGCGKTFFGRWVQEYAKKKGFATTEVQISETETPLHRLETVYRRAMEQLCTADCFLGAFRSVIDGWFYGLEEDVLAEGTIDPADEKGLAKRADELLEQRLADITRATPQFAAALRGYRAAQRQNDHNVAEGLAGWLAGQPARRSDDQESCGHQGGRGPLRRPQLLAGPAADPQGLGLLRPGACPGRDRDVATGPRRRARKGTERPAATDRRHRWGPLPQLVPAHHGNACLLRWAAGDSAP